MESIVIGMFDDSDEALALVNDLESRGVPRERIDVEAAPASDVPKEERSFFQRLGDVLTGQDRGALTEGLRRGGTVVSARVDDPRVDETVYLMKAHGAIDIDEQMGANDPSQAGPAAEAPATEGVARMPVVEEELKVGKRTVERGGVRVYTHVTERPVEEDVQLRTERVVVERRPVDQPIRGDEPGLFQEGTVEFTERSEELVIGKESRVVEEVVIGKVVDQQVQTVHDTVRRTDVSVEQISGGGAAPDEFREHWQTQFATSGYPYEHYAPAYRYGAQLASSDLYRDRPWDDIQADARNNWETHNPGTWDRFVGAIRYGWDRPSAAASGTASRSPMREQH